MHRVWAARIILTIGLIAVGAGASLTLARSRFQAGLSQAWTDLSARRFEAARRWLVPQSVRRPRDVEIAYLLGLCERALEHPGAAADALTRVPLTSRFGGDAALALAEVLIEDLGRYAKAEEVLRAAMAAAGHGRAAAPFRYRLSRLLFWEGRTEEMQRLTQEGWDSSPDWPGELHDLWRIDNAPPTFEPIQAAVERASAANPDDDRVWLARANLAMHAGQFDEAARWLDPAMARRPNDPIIWRARLRWAISTDRLEEARRCLPHIPAGQFSEREVLQIRAWLAARRGRTDDERAALERLIERVPGDTRALERLATLAIAAGRNDRAAELRRRKAEVDRTKEQYYRTLEGPEPTAHAAKLAKLAEKLGRGFEARGWWAIAARSRPDDPDVVAAVARLGPPRPEPTADPDDNGISLARAVEPDAGRTVRPDQPGDRPSIAEGPGRLRRPSFRDDAEATGLRFTFDNGRSPRRQIPETTSGGVGVLDYDSDGNPDLYVVQGGPFPPSGTAIPNRDRLFHNRGDGTFEDATARSGIEAIPGGYGHGVTVGDFDNDGHPDLFVTRWRSYVLLHNRGDGTFEDATEPAGLGGDRDWPTSAAFADLDGDGDLDLYVCHYLVWDEEHPTLCPRQDEQRETIDPDRRFDYCMPNPFPASPDHLFRNDGGRFVDVTAEAGIVDPDGRGLGVVAADVDDDGRVDLFVANDTTADYLWHNLGGLKFEEVGTPSGVASSSRGAFQAGMGTAVGDLDGDGRPDLLVTNFYGESTTYHHNLGALLFSDASQAIGLSGPTRFLVAFGIVLLDANNDGRLDVAQTNGHVYDMRPTAPVEMPALLLLGSADGRLVDATEDAGPAWTTPRIGRGIATVDADNDGRLDVILIPQGTPIVYLHNRTEGGHFVTLLLEGTRSNRDAVGAVVTIEAGGRRQRAWRYGGGSYQSASDPRIHFGLEVDQIDEVEVKWPSGQVDRYRDLAVDRAYRLSEGDARPSPMGGPTDR